MPLSKILTNSLNNSLTVGTLTGTNGATIQGLTVGKGGGAVGASTAIGFNALNANTTGENTAVGYTSLPANTTGEFNTAVGRNSMLSNTTGNNNVAVGRQSLNTNTTGGANVAIGTQSLLSNTTASDNTAVGYQAGYSNTTGTGLTFLGKGAGYAVTGNYNTIVGWRAGEAVTSGTDNTFVGALSGLLSTGSQNTFIGGPISGVSNGTGTAMTTGSKNCIIGRFTGNQGGLDIRTASNYIVLSDGDGNPRIYIAGTNGYFFPNIRSSSDANNDLRFNTGNGEFYYQTSSQRYKENIVDLEFDTSNLYNLRPVSYDDKATGNRCYGLIAEETFVQIPNVVVKRDIDGESLPDSIPYSMLSVVIINEMKKLKTLVDTQATLITSLTARIAALENK
jgi:hypothetical protein